MRGNLVEGLRRRAALVGVLTLAAVGFGAASLATLPSGIYPEMEFQRVVVVARSGVLSPEVMQTVVTRPLEEAVVTVPGLRTLRSRTIRGACELSARFETGVDMWRAFQLVEARVNGAREAVPTGTTTSVERVLPTALPILTMNVSGAADPRVLRDAAVRVIRPVLTRLPGVGSVDVVGGDVREFEVILKPDALAALHLTPTALGDALVSQNLVEAVGRVVDAYQSITAIVDAEATTTEAIAALPIAMGESGPVPLSAVADVTLGAEDRMVSVAGPDGDSVVVSVGSAPGASAERVATAAREAVERLVAAQALPPGVRVEVVYDQSELIRDAMHGVRDAILLGIALALAVLAVFLRDVRAGATAAVAVPVTLLATFGAMKLTGQTLNLMTLGGLAVAIGLVVDDAIVIVDAIVRRMEEGLGVREAAEKGTRDLLAAVVGTTFTTVVVLAPLWLIPGVVGRFFGALATTLSAAVLLSLLVAVTLVPLLASVTLRARPAHDAGGMLSRGYGALVRRLIRRPALGVAALVVLLGLGVFAARGVPTGFLPAMDEGAFVLDFLLPPGLSLEETNSLMAKVDHVLATTPAVVTFTRRTGAEMGPAAATQQNRGDVLVRLVPRGRRASVFEVIADVRARVSAEVPEAHVEFVQVLQDVLDDLSGSPRPIEVKLFGEDPRALEAGAHDLADRLSTVPELEDLFGGMEGSVPVLRWEVRREVAARLGVSPADVAADLAASMAGRVTNHVRVGDRMIGVRVRLPDALRFDPAAVEEVPMAWGGKPVPVRTVVELSRPAGPSVLVRENLSTVVVLTAAAANGDLGGATTAVQDAIASRPLPPGLRVELGGQQESARRTRNAAAGVLAVGVVLVLGILLLQLGSLRLSLVVLMTAPLALVGALATLAVTGIALNASSLTGCILLVGLVVKNGILLLEKAHHEEAALGFAEALARAGERRLRPILMTTAATVAGLVPLALGLGAGSELQRPLAVATIGGLLLSTFVTLFAVPSLAMWIAPGRRGTARPPSSP